MTIKKLFGFLLEIFFPKFCVGCNKIGTYLCYMCYETIEFSILPPTKKIDSLESITTCCKYSGVTKQLIFQFKYHNIINLSKIISEIMHYSSVLPNCKYYTYVPIHWKKRNIRGYNQSKLIAEHLANITNATVLPLLKKNSHTKSQKNIQTKKERYENILDSFSYINSNQITQRKSLLIIDDVFTSGATLTACADILKKNGWKEIHGLCFAQRS